MRLFPASGRGAEAWGVDTVKPLEGGQGMAFLGGGALGMTAVRRFDLDRVPGGGAGSTARSLSVGMSPRNRSSSSEEMPKTR